MGGRVWQYSTDEQIALNSIAKRLQIDNSWQAIRTTVHCDLLLVGASKSSIEQALTKVGNYTEYDSWNGAITIVFDDYFTLQAVDKLVLWFENDHLAAKRLEVTPDATLPIECP
jgi:hypothetical protein